jgi:polyphosphate kinase
VAGLIQQVESGVTEPSVDGLGPREQLRRIHSVVASLVEDQFRCWHEQLVPALAEEGIAIVPASQLSPSELNWAKTYFREQVFPVLTPLALDQAHPFPQLGNKTLNIVAHLDNPAAPGSEPLIAILPVPRILPRLVRLDVEAAPRPAGSGSSSSAEILKLCAGELFPGYRLLGAHAFRVTRNSDLYIDEEEAENLLKQIEEELRNLRRGAAVRLEIEAGVDDGVFSTLCSHLNLSREYVFRLPEPLNLLRLLSLTEIDRPELKYPVFTPVQDSPLREIGRCSTCCAPRTCCCITLTTRSIPWSISSSSPRAIRRSSPSSRRSTARAAIRPSCMRSSKPRTNGKQVTALVELRARFDEANNIQWARQLEEAGVHVVYGLVGHKTHCKLCLVVRREGEGLRRYAHLGTGNYNPRTARLYTDLSLFTTREPITGEVAQLFNSLTGFGRSPEFQHLLVAPYNLTTACRSSSSARPDMPPPAGPRAFSPR